MASGGGSHFGQMQMRVSGAWVNIFMGDGLPEMGLWWILGSVVLCWWRLTTF